MVQNMGFDQLLGLGASKNAIGVRLSSRKNPYASMKSDAKGFKNVEDEISNIHQAELLLAKCL